MIKKLELILFSATLAAFSAPTTLPVPSKLPAERFTAHRRLAQEGVQFHDLGDYHGAILKFEQVLQENPDDVGALFELSNTLMASKEYERSLQTAMKGAEYKSKLLPDFYSVIGSDLDELGDQTSAVTVYEQGMKSFPESAILPFNLAVTYEKTKKLDDARRLYETALRADPNHVSSHYRLASVFQQTGYSIPALLAYLRFLEVARDTQRSQQALQFSINYLLGSAQQGSGANQINVTINLAGSDRTDEGDFRGPTAMIGLGSVLRFTEAGKNLSKAELVRQQEELLFAAFDSDKALRKEKKKFAASYYAAYFRELLKAHHSEAFTYVVLRQSGWPEVSEWLNKNSEKVNAYSEWAKAYIWPNDVKARK
jgi:tetratricopeptide (TPR) repeat protein